MFLQLQTLLFPILVADLGRSQKKHNVAILPHFTNHKLAGVITPDDFTRQGEIQRWRLIGY
jgi:hypothetical protein